ncbi:MAG: AAA family ATPase [Desulfatitalea sp.]|nr:AAA family ATPase [Desulfatitalea sp.]
MFVPRRTLEEQCGTAFDVDFHTLRDGLDALAAEGRIRISPDTPEEAIYLTELYTAEATIARRIRAMLEIPTPPAPLDAGQIMAAVAQCMAIQLSDEQLAVLQSVFTQRVVIITGGPGTGKTTLVRAIAAVFAAAGKICHLAAPTGRAARRMAELTGRPAVTLHKLLGFNLNEGRFERDQDDPLDTEALIVDEASMVDGPLMGHLTQALPLKAHLILVGDVFQLPSVGPGAVLADLIASGAAHTFALKEVFRQAAGSPIIANAHRVRQGSRPDMPPLAHDHLLGEFAFIPQPTPDATARAIIDLCVRRIPEQTGLDPVRDVQVLTPMHKGVVGTLNLNQRLQAALNPHAANGKPWAGRFYPTDKVMHLRNNYQKAVFNGEIGTISAIHPNERRLVVTFDSRQVHYDDIEGDELALAYAISVHKSQGSEYPAIIVPMVTHHYVMLQRNLLYTALTRARQMVILVGSEKAVRIAVAANQPQQRMSMLSWRLGGGEG